MKKLNKDYSAMENTVEAYLCNCVACSCDCYECAGYVGSANVQASKEAGIRSNNYVSPVA